jgi:membrane-associated phospholipid phosphatase
MNKTTDAAGEPGAANLTRRNFFRNLGKAAAGAAAAGVIVPFVAPEQNSAAAQRRPSPLSGNQRALNCYNLRTGCATANYVGTSHFPRVSNGDEYLYPNRINSFSKGLPHQPNGEVDPAAYNVLLDALQTGNSAMFDVVPMAGQRKLTNPQSGFAYDMEGADAFTFVQPPAPTFASKEIGAEIAENYWMAILRDVPYQDYASSPLAAAASADLTLFGSEFKGAKDANGHVTPNLLFRGLTQGDKTGPYVSQFFYQTCPFGATNIEQKMRTVLGIAANGQNYMTDFDSWLSVQSGVNPGQADLFDPTLRYLRNGRDLSQWVHMDVLFQAYFQALLVLSSIGAPTDDGNPYKSSPTQMGFGTFGDPHITALVCEVATRALKAVWNQKWLVHRRARPEVFAERVDRKAYHGANYPVHSEILSSVTTGSRLGGYLPAGNAFLPMAFPEGSPLHPSYGAGHASVAGACVTVLKAWFDESHVLENPVVPDSSGQVLVPYSGTENLTVGGELNKLASNVALGRNTAGVHWRSDATESLLLGEAVAISILKDQKGCYNEQFNGFTVTKFDGTTVIV